MFVGFFLKRWHLILENSLKPILKRDFSRMISIRYPYIKMDFCINRILDTVNADYEESM